MQVEELLKRYANGERTFESEDLRAANLEGVVLIGANLACSTLFAANFKGADLRNVDLRGANLQQANLEDANLSGADLSLALLRRANLRNAILDETKCEGTQFTGAILPNGKLYSAAEYLAYSMNSQPLTSEEIQSDLQQFRKPQSKPIPQPSRKRTTWNEFKQDLPWIPLSFFITSYIVFGLLLAASPKASSIQFWLMALLSSLFWRLTMDLVFIIPAFNGFLVFFEYEPNIFILGAMILCFLMTFINSKISRSVTTAIAFQESFWLINIIFSALVSLLSLNPLLIIATILGSIGMLLPLQMDTARYQLNQIALVTGLSAAIGLTLGSIFKMILL